MRCCVCKQINMAYRTDIVQCDASFCDENCRSWMDIEWNQFKVRILFRTTPRLQAVDLRPCVRFGQWFRKLMEPGKAYWIVCRTELCCANGEAVVFTRHANSEAHQQKLWAESSNTTLPWVEWCLLLIHGTICWTDLLHLKIIYWTFYAALTSSTWWPRTAYMSVLQQSSLVFKLSCYSVSKNSTFKRLFHKLFVTFGGRTVFSALIVW